MAMTLEQIKNQLSAIEPDEGTYFGIGSQEIPLLEQLLQNEEVWMASRAVFAISRISDPRAAAILSRTAGDRRPEVRVALAASIGNLRPGDANHILLKLLADKELGVRKFAVKAVSATHDAAVHAKLRDVQIRDSVPAIRDIAKNKLRALKLMSE